MPTPDLSALIRWPNVPACYGWLSLDRRGRWRLQGECVTHSGLIEFFNRQYSCDIFGRWFVQNGPQRVYVALEYTPWVLTLSSASGLLTHTGQCAEEISAVRVDEQGCLLIVFSHGIGVLDDRDLFEAYLDVVNPDGQPASDAELEAALENAKWEGLKWRGFPLETVASDRVESEFHFVRHPVPAEET